MADKVGTVPNRVSYPENPMIRQGTRYPAVHVPGRSCWLAGERENPSQHRDVADLGPADVVLRPVIVHHRRVRWHVHVREGSSSPPPTDKGIPTPPPARNLQHPPEPVGRPLSFYLLRA